MLDSVMLPSTSDADLLERWRAGDKAAGQQLFARYYDPLERFFINKVATGVDDLLQETFVACVENRDRVEQPDKFRCYLFSIAYNVLRNHLRKRYRQGAELDVDEISIHDLAPGPMSLMVEYEEQRILLEALRSIPLAEQTLLELHYWERLTTTEMAAVLAVPVGTVRGRLQRARTSLKKAIRQVNRSAEVLDSTLTRLEDWAAACRQSLQETRLDGVAPA